MRHCSFRCALSGSVIAGTPTHDSPRRRPVRRVPKDTRGASPTPAGGLMIRHRPAWAHNSPRPLVHNRPRHRVAKCLWSLSSESSTQRHIGGTRQLPVGSPGVPRRRHARPISGADYCRQLVLAQLLRLNDLSATRGAGPGNWRQRHLPGDPELVGWRQSPDCRPGSVVGCP